MKLTRRWRVVWLVVCMLVSAALAWEMPFAKPADVGMSGAKLAQVNVAVQKLVDEQKVAGAITVVARKGKIVHFETFGMRDIETKKPMERDTIMRFYSMTKPIASVAAMILYDEGKFQLDDPLAKHIPEFEGLKVYKKSEDGEAEYVEPTRQVTVRDLMRHTSGFTYGIFSNTAVDKMYRQKLVFGGGDLQAMAKKLAQIPLLHQPGTRWHYSVSTDVLGHLVERLSGQKLDAFFKERIFKPLDMKDTGFYVPKEKAYRFSSCYGPKEPGGLKVTTRLGAGQFLTPPTFLSGGGGLVSTARDYVRFCQMLLNKGELNGVRLLKTETVEIMTKNQLPPNVFWGGNNGFGLGFSVRLEPAPAGKAHVGEYGWGGAASTHFWISPEDDLAVVALSQYMPFSGQLQDAVKPLVYNALIAD
ncbi:MAG: beta-lactamase family protein [Phycisphaerales bacterium]|nr:MAG: beta-lactamase family protein [Phycisphaerales bacterium]